MDRGTVRRWIPVAALFLATAAARLYAAGLPPEGPESLHFSVARHLGAAPANVEGGPFDGLPFKVFLQARPLFILGLAGPAQISFEAARATSFVVSALLPLALYAVLRQLGARRAVAAPVALVAAIHPLFVMGSVRIEPLSWMVVALLGALLAQLRGRPLVSGALLGVAIACDRLALPAGAWLLVMAIGAARRRGDVQLIPLRADAQVSAHALALAFVPLPLIYSGLPPFGLYAAPSVVVLVAQSFLGLVLVPLVLAGFAARRTRPWAALGVLYPALYLVALWFLGRSATPQQALPAAVFALIAAAVVVEERLAKAGGPRSRATTAGWALLVAVLVYAPTVVALPAVVDPARTMSLDAHIAQGRPTQTWVEAAGWLAGADSVLLIDIPWDRVDFPFAYLAGGVPVRYEFSTSPGDLGSWARAIETNGTRTLVIVNGLPLNAVVIEVYDSCVRRNEGGFVLIEGAGCAGSAERLFETYVNRPSS